MPQAYVKTPGMTLDVQIDLRDWVAARVADGSVAQDIAFIVHSETGAVFASSMTTIGLIDIVITGGEIGRVLQFGARGKTAENDEITEMRTLRIRDPALYELIGNEVDLGSANALVTETGETLVTETGELLVWQ